MTEPSEPPVETPPAPAPSWLKAVPLWLKVLAPLVVVALVVTIVVLAIPHSKNAQACSDFEKAYNALAISVKDKMGAELVGAARDSLVSAAVEAHDEASGAVKSDLSDVVTLSDGFVGGDSDAGVAFLLAAQNVAHSCAADGASITLNDF